MRHKLQPQLMITDDDAIKGTTSWFLRLAAAQTSNLTTQRKEELVNGQERQAELSVQELKILLEREAESQQAITALL